MTHRSSAPVPRVFIERVRTLNFTDRFSHREPLRRSRPAGGAGSRSRSRRSHLPGHIGPRAPRGLVEVDGTSRIFRGEIEHVGFPLRSRRGRSRYSRCGWSRDRSAGERGDRAASASIARNDELQEAALASVFEVEPLPGGALKATLANGGLMTRRAREACSSAKDGPPHGERLWQLGGDQRRVRPAGVVGQWARHQDDGVLAIR
jgi:hypothetical protein